ncbi:MAG: TRAP transporter small permease subunit [Chromatiaceae bacterium]|nr:TRAP transporter small permease subunit [Gammaproteobacteria bacterium]MCP5427800.1 TRAP transporter small permease subunit [Chromatiaceae bacterium]MCB1872986.1 TRAP transporter small permease subunit [Gammaproteobacteria bacterium]MCB1881767.1 TRAP transporter small permease subunit [Gammaproteobacteria bacterium]MCB1905201.1 TRAP transporter small permease subunit [Gammaproteobacteria bacterium]
MEDAMAESESEQSMSHMPDLSHHLHLPTTRTSLFLDRLLDRIGSWASWLWLAVMAVILLSVIMRYAFGQGSIMLEEITWHIYGAAWLVGLSYALVHDDHVRVDVLHEMFSPRTKAWVEFFGILLLLLPFLCVFLWDSIAYFWQAFELGERSQAPDGLPARWALKFFLPLSLLLLIGAAFARLLKSAAQLFGRPAPLHVDPFVKDIEFTPPQQK